MAPALSPEQRARQAIDGRLAEAGWVVQDREEINLAANRGLVVREYPIKSNYGFADSLPFVDGKPVGVVEG